MSASSASAAPRQPSVESPVLKAQDAGAGLMGMVLALADVLTLSLAVLIAFPVWSLVNPKVPAFQPLMGIAPACCAIMFAFQGVYPGIGMTAVEHMRTVSRGITLVYLVLTAAMFLTKDWWADSRGGFFLSLVLSLILAPTGRWLCGWLFSARDWWGVRIMILGAGGTARRVVFELKSNRVLGYRPVVCLDDDLSKHGNCEGVPVVGTLEEAPRLAAAYGTRYALIAMPSMPRLTLTRHLQRWSSIFHNIVIIPDLFGVASLWIERRDLGGILALEIRHNLLKRTNRRVKRVVDVIVASLAMVVTSPLVIVAALWIRRASPGAAFYVQEREGEGGVPIRIRKLRTMYVGADEMLAKHLESNSEARREWDQFCKLKHDPRILPGIGHLLRKTSLDEIPQLWNIVKGEMSLVGPRPFPVYHNERFKSDFRLLRTRVPPGLTGMWQVNARSNGDLNVQTALDTYYIQNWSLWLDIYILIRTVRAVVAGDGAC